MLAEGGGEAVGSAFDKVLRHALSPLDAPTLLRAAARYDLEPHRLRFLRRTLSSRGGEGEPTLGRVQRTWLRLLAGRRAEALLLRLLKDALLLRAPKPPPGGPILARRLPRLEGWVTGPPQVAGFVSTCTVLVASVGVWCVRALVLGPARA